MKKLLGIVFLVAAATVVYFGSVGWPSLDINLWSLIPVGLFLFFHSGESFEKRLQGQSDVFHYCLYHRKCDFGSFANFKWLGDWSRCAGLCRYWLSLS